ncbi:MAG: two-component sensor histidine kinase, partial [Desulfovibrionaceae bacterium]
MDGLPTGLRRSLQFRLSLGLSLVVVAMALAAGAFSFLSAYDEAIELQDQQLRQMAALAGLRHAPPAPYDPSGPSGAADTADDDPEARVAVQFLRSGAAPAAQPPGGLPGLPADLPEGLSTVTLDGVPWRVCVRSPQAGIRVAVGQRTQVRDEIARDSALRTVTPLLLVIPALLALTGGLVRRMFRP